MYNEDDYDGICIAQIRNGIQTTLTINLKIISLLFLMEMMVLGGLIGGIRDRRRHFEY